MNVPIKRGTARRLGLRLPQPKTVWLDGDAFRNPVVDAEGGYWLATEHLAWPVAFDEVKSDGAGGVIATGHLRQLGFSVNDVDPAALAKLARSWNESKS